MERGPFYAKGSPGHPKFQTFVDDAQCLSSVPLIHHYEFKNNSKKYIGGGGYGKVYQVILKGNFVAQKECINEDMKSVEALRKEIEFLDKFRHPNIVSIIGYTKNPFSVIMEFSLIGSLDYVIRNENNSYPPVLGIKWTIDVGKALKFLHEQNPAVIHRDLKALNVLLFDTEEGTIAKLCDFGETGLQKNSMSREKGTTMYNAPELLLGLHQYTEKVDIYSLGILLWEVLSRERPFKGLEPQVIRFQVGKDKLILDFELIPKSIDDGNRNHILRFINQCLSNNPKDRPPIDTALGQLKTIFDHLMKDKTEFYVTLLKEALEVDKAVIENLYIMLKEARDCMRNCKIANTAGTIGNVVGTTISVLTVAGAGALTGGAAFVLSAIGIGFSVSGSATSTGSSLVNNNSMKKLNGRLETLLETRNEIQSKFQKENLTYIPTEENTPCYGSEFPLIRSMVETGQIGSTIVSSAVSQLNSGASIGARVIGRGILSGASAIVGLALVVVDTALLVRNCRNTPATILEIEEKIKILNYEIIKLEKELQRVAPHEKDPDLETFEIL